MMYTKLQPFLSNNLKNVTKCAWFLRADEEQHLYNYHAMDNAGDGVAFNLFEKYDEFTKQTNFVMSQYADEKFSFDEYNFPALELILARYFRHLIRVKAEN